MTGPIIRPLALVGSVAAGVALLLSATGAGDSGKAGPAARPERAVSAPSVAQPLWSDPVAQRKPGRRQDSACRALVWHSQYRQRAESPPGPTPKPPADEVCASEPDLDGRKLVVLMMAWRAMSRL
jgi:hypothetical protein